MAKKVKITVKIGGKVQMESDKHELARDAIRKIATIANPAAETVAQGLSGFDKLGGASNFANVLLAGNPESVIEILEDGNLSASYKLHNFARKILVALDAKNWTGTIVTAKSEESGKDTVEQVMPELDLS